MHVYIYIYIYILYMYYHLLSMCKGFLIQSWVLLPVTSGSCFFQKTRACHQAWLQFSLFCLLKQYTSGFFWTNTNCWWNKIGPKFRLQEALLLFWVVRLREPLVFILVLKNNFEGDTIIIQTNTKPKRNGNAMVILEMSELGMFHVSIKMSMFSNRRLNGISQMAFGRGCEHFEHVSRLVAYRNPMDFLMNPLKWFWGVMAPTFCQQHHEG